jgi:hypothetical protein
VARDLKAPTGLGNIAAVSDPAPARDRARTETHWVEIGAQPDGVIAVLADARLQPRWAPGFVDVVTGDADSGWVGTTEELASLASPLTQAG